MAIGSFFELAHSSSSYASFVQSAMQQISGQGTAPQAENTNGSKFAGVMTDTLSIERAKKTKEIMSGYDMTHMSRNEMIEMAGKLEKSGIITWDQYFELTAPHFDEFARPHSAGVIPPRTWCPVAPTFSTLRSTHWM